jgi:hypothetical protein
VNWYQTLAVEYEDESGVWRRVGRLRSSPPLPSLPGPYDKATGVEYLLSFEPVQAKAIRVSGEPPKGTGAKTTSLSELRVYDALPDSGALP